jgi:hypothetical protein
MCGICDKAKALPLDQALRLVQQAMQQRENKNQQEHLDRLVGELVGLPEPKADKGVEGAFETFRRTPRSYSR